MRKLLYDTLITALASTAVGNRVYLMSSLGVVEGTDSRPPWPYVCYREFPERVHNEVFETSDASTKTFQIYVYDDRGSYSNIDAALRAVRDAVKALEGTRSADGAFCMRSRWTGMSQDFFDQQYQSNVRFGTVQLTSSE